MCQNKTSFTPESSILMNLWVPDRIEADVCLLHKILLSISAQSIRKKTPVKIEYKNAEANLSKPKSFQKHAADGAW